VHIHVQSNLLEAIYKYRNCWAKNQNVDAGVLNEWQGVLTECILDRIRILRKKKFKQRREQVLGKYESSRNILFWFLPIRHATIL